jgi:hypothetical protein
MISIPEAKAAAVCGRKLKGPKTPVGSDKNALAMPPNAMDKTPLIGPKIMPIKGAVRVAALMNLPSTPMTGNTFQTEKTVYRAAKQDVRAIFFADGDCDFEIIGMSWKDLAFKCQSSNEETISQGSLK